MTTFWAVIMLIPGVNVLGLIAVMLPLWMLHDMGLGGLGAPREGFFVPSGLGYVVGALVLWSLFFVLFLVMSRLADKPGQGSR